MKIKHIHKYILLYGIALLCLSSCEDRVEENKLSLELEYETFAASNVGGEKALNVFVSGKWVASTENPWVKVSPASGENTTTCTLSIDPSVSNVARIAAVRFAAATGEVKTLRITQMGFDKQIVLSLADTTIASSAKYGERYFTMNITTNVSLTHTIVDASLSENITWVKCDNADEFDAEATGATPQSVELRFDYENNVEPLKRVALVSFTSSELASPVNFTINQDAGPVITDDAVGDSLSLLIIQDKLNVTSPWNGNERMEYWTGVSLWKKTDAEVKENPEMLGRIRSLEIKYLRVSEAIPVEIGNLKCLENLYIGTNGNKAQLSIDLSKNEDGIGKLVNLKELIIFSYGLMGELPESWKNLVNLEALSLAGNNFATIPTLLTKENFPSLKYLAFTANRRYGSLKLNPLSASLDMIGLHHYGTDDLLKNLLKWNELEYLALNNCVLEGHLPTAEELGITEVYTSDDFVEKGDTLNFLLGKPKVLPNMKSLRLNLNFFNGEIPEWILYHPYLMYWSPWSLIYGHDANLLNTAGEPVGYNNTPLDWNYYWEAFPLLKPTRVEE